MLSREDVQCNEDDDSCKDGSEILEQAMLLSEKLSLLKITSSNILRRSIPPKELILMKNNITATTHVNKPVFTQ